MSAPDVRAQVTIRDEIKDPFEQMLKLRRIPFEENYDKGGYTTYLMNSDRECAEARTIRDSLYTTEGLTHH